MSILYNIKRQIPNAITLCNLVCGAAAARQAAIGNYSQAGCLILLGIFFDFFDGLFARLLKVSSPVGKELDSLADVVTSGVAPGMMLYSLLSTSDKLGWLSYTAFLLPAFAAYRLAKFNLDTRQTHSFLGLPAPANALIWVGIIFAFDNPVGFCTPILETPVLICLALLSLLTDILMVGETPMFSLKFNFKDLSWQNNRVQYVFLFGCLLLLVAAFCLRRSFPALPLSLSAIILWYVVLSLITQRKEARP